MHRMLVLFGISLFLLSACSDKEVVKSSSEPEELITSSDNAKGEMSSSADFKSVDIKTVDDLYAVFAEYKYTMEAWHEGSRAVPRITFAKVGKQWNKTSTALPVQVKKEVFFRLMAPLVLMSNEKILRERQQVVEASLDAVELRKIALKYRVIKSVEDTITPEIKATLLLRIDILPPSLALAQAAEESGWATSRFTHEGNAFFGQWDFSGNGMRPKQQRKELGDYGIARFDSPLASVEGYMLNINTTFAYESLRQVRSKLRADNKPISGPALAQTLDKYSERGQAYIDGLLGMISYNKLEEVDKAYLMDNPLVHLR